ncbi:hypothetical protein C8Q80DRAFT_1266975 [Daedaleopsis nitida]|nr:hypothetical protein C8Q80DRAFT_1266975 [Daedaleopsis nitida]
MTVDSVVHAMMNDVGGLEDRLGILEGKTSDLAAANMANLNELIALDSVLVKVSSRLRQLINALSPIHRLPPEILAHIFTFVPRIYQPRTSKILLGTFGPFALGPPGDIALLMEVCHRWHDTLLDYAKLWAVVDHMMFSLQPCYRNYIHRNPTGPLFVYVKGHPSKETWQLVKQSKKRIVELRLSDMTANTFCQTIAFSADALTACAIDNVAIPSDASTCTLFKGRALQLRAFTMNSLGFIPSGHTNVRYTFAQLLDLLRGCAPTLQTLFLCEVAGAGLKDIPTPGEVEEERRVVLQRLRKLSIMDKDAAAGTDSDSDQDTAGDTGHFQVALCAHLTLPADCFIYIGFACTKLFPAVVDAIERQVPRELTNMRVLGGKDIMDPNGLPPSSASVLELINDGKSQGIRLDAKYGFSRLTSEQAACPCLCAAIESSGLFSKIEHIYISAHVFVHFAQCHLVVRGLSRLKTLFIRKILRQLRNTLAPIMTVSGGEDIIFPQLTTLTIFFSISEVDDLYTLVKTRQDAGYALSRFVLSFRCTSGPNLEQLCTLTEFYQLMDQCTVLACSNTRRCMLPKDVTWESPIECSTKGNQVSEYWPGWD